MCGIAAVLTGDGHADVFSTRQEWAACMRAIERRGPDGSGSWCSPSSAALLGHTRLAIVDPSERGAQPMVVQNGSVAITYNGEIYNAPDLRDRLVALGHRFRSSCDTEVLVRAWLEWGEGVLDEIHGMYAFVIWDDDSRELFAAVDHAAMKPMCWKHEPGRLLIASDADAIRALSGASEQIDTFALRQLLTLGCCPHPRTMWTGISKLGPGGVLRWKPGQQPRISCHWAPPERIDVSATIDNPSFDSLFEGVVAEHMFADVPVGAFLSAGIDSAAIVAAAVRVGTHPGCYTLSMDGKDDESVDASRVAQRLGLKQSTSPAGTDIEQDLASCALAYDEPQGYSALLNAVRISRLAREQVKAVITGDGGDEAFGGYLWQREAGPDAWQNLPERKCLVAESNELSKLVSSPDASDSERQRARLAFGSHSFTHAYASRVFPGFHPAEAFALTESLGGAFDHESAVSWLSGVDRPALPHVRRVQRLDLLGFCAASVLPKIDRAAMQIGLETRSPLLDRRLLEIGMSAPVTKGENEPTGSRSRPHLRRYVSEQLGEAFTARGKQGFSLRVDSELNQWRNLSRAVDDGPLVRAGMLRADWRRFVPLGDTPRLRLLTMLNAWAKDRV